MKIVIDNFFEENGYIKGLKDKLEQAGFDVVVLEYIPYIKEDLALPEKFQGDLVFAYGTIQFIKKIQNKYSNIVAFFNNEAFKVSNYLSNAGDGIDLFLNKDLFFITYGMLRQNPLRYFDMIGDDKVFIRPDSGNKVFTGTVLTKNNIKEELFHLDKFPSVVNNTILLVSSVKNIKREYRAVIVGNDVVAASLYLEDDEFKMSSDIPDDVYEIAGKYASLPIDNKVDDYVVCDVAELSNGDFKIIELNSVSTSDLYMCDPHSLKLVAEHYMRSIEC